MTEETLSDDRVKVIRRLLFVVLGLAAVLVVIGPLMIVSDSEQGGAVVLLIAVAYGVLCGLSLRAVERRAPGARRLVIATGVVVIALSVLLVGILIGLLTVIAGVGLLVVTVAPEREPS